MARYQPQRTWTDVTSQAGFPSPGAGAQTSGPPSLAYNPYAEVNPDYTPVYPTKGKRSWFKPAHSQRGFPEPEGHAQRRPFNSMPNRPPVFGGVVMVETPYFDRGAAAYVPNYGKVFYNPIGAGIFVTDRPKSSYGPSAVYENGAIWWTAQSIPTSVGLNGLNSPEELLALLGATNVQAAVRTTG